MTLNNDLSYQNLGLTSLEQIPDDVKRLDISNNLINSLSGIPKGVEELRCSSNYIGTLKPLHSLSNLRSLGCSYTHIKNLKGLPPSIKKIVASFTQLESLEGMPNDMETLYASYCKIKNVKHCTNVKVLDISANLLENIDDLPEGIETLCISNNPTLSSCPQSLPSTLKIFRCSGCVNLPPAIYDLLPNTIKLVECSKNNHENCIQIQRLKSSHVEIVY